MLGNAPALCTANANPNVDTPFIGAANIGYLELKNFVDFNVFFLI